MKRKESFRGTLLVHKSSALEKLYCLGEHGRWGQLLLSTSKKYESFLTHLIQQKFYADQNDVSISSIASDLNLEKTIVSKYLNQIYDDLCSLNDEHEELFKTAGIKHKLYFKHYDNRTCFTVWLPQTPREYEHFSFFFIKAKVGTDNFWVKSVDHGFEDGEYFVSLMLESEQLNRYREQLLDRALFERLLRFDEPYNLYSVEIDQQLHEWYNSNTRPVTIKDLKEDGDTED